MIQEPGYLIKLPSGEEVRIFESPERYLRSNPNFTGTDLATGGGASTIDWCETNYSVTRFLCEFWNTLSNLPMVFIAVFGVLMVFRSKLERRFLAPFTAFFFIGIGSAAFHARLSKVSQFADEFPMIIAITSWIWIFLAIDPEEERRHKRLYQALAVLIFLYNVAYGVAHWYVRFVAFHQVTFSVLMLITMVLVWRERSRANATGKHIGTFYMQSLVLGCSCWISEQFLCETLSSHAWLPNPQLHAMWHVFTAIASFSGTLFLVYQRSFHLGEGPKLEWWAGALPYLVRGKPKKHLK